MEPEPPRWPVLDWRTQPLYEERRRYLRRLLVLLDYGSDKAVVPTVTEIYDAITAIARLANEGGFPETPVFKQVSQMLIRVLLSVPMPLDGSNDVEGERALKHEVHHQAARVAHAIAHRDDAIVRMHEQGASLREIAQAANLTHTGARKVLQRRGKL
jgi:hypothetical protein